MPRTKMTANSQSTLMSMSGSVTHLSCHRWGTDPKGGKWVTGPVILHAKEQGWGQTTLASYFTATRLWDLLTQCVSETWVWRANPSSLIRWLSGPGLPYTLIYQRVEEKPTRWQHTSGEENILDWFCSADRVKSLLISKTCPSSCQTSASHICHFYWEGGSNGEKRER